MAWTYFHANPNEIDGCKRDITCIIKFTPGTTSPPTLPSRRPHHFLSSHISNTTPIIPIVPIAPISPIAPTFPIIPISPTSQHSRRSPPSLKSLKALRSLKSLSAPILSGRSPDFRFRIRHYKMSPGGIRCRMPPGRLKVAVTYSPTFAVPSA